MQPSFSGLLGLAILLIGTMAFEFTRSAMDDAGMIASTPRLFLTVPEPVAAPPVPDKDRAMLADGIIARPLFAATRRPTAVPATPAPPLASLPRLAGILVDGRSRSAIFAAVGEGRPLVVQEGAQVGGHTVQSIGAGQVTLSGPGAPQVLRPTFDPRPQSAASGTAAAGPGANKDAAPFASALNIMQSLRGLPGASGAAAR